MLIKPSNVTVGKLCYQLIKGSTISSKYDWYVIFQNNRPTHLGFRDLVIKTLIEDINQLSNASNEAGKEGAEELCIWALRTVASLCGASIKLQQFFKKHKREIEVRHKRILLLQD